MVEHGRDTRVVTVTGEIDPQTAPELAAVLTAQLAVAQIVVVDLDGVEFLASAELTVLFDASELAAEQHRDLRLVCHCPSINRTLRITGLRERFGFADNVSRALMVLLQTNLCRGCVQDPESRLIWGRRQ